MQNLYKSVLPELRSSVAYHNSSSHDFRLCFMIISATFNLLRLRAVHFCLVTLSLDAAADVCSFAFLDHLHYALLLCLLSRLSYMN